MWVSLLSRPVPSIPSAFLLSRRRPSRSQQRRRHSFHFPRRVRPSLAPSDVRSRFALPPPSRAVPTHPPRQGASSFSPVPPDRLKLQSVASPSVGTLIRGRLHCSGTLSWRHWVTNSLSRLPQCPLLCRWTRRAASVFLSFRHPPPSPLFSSFYRRISVFMDVRSAS